MTGTPEYGAWQGIVQRSIDGRITVCDEWMASFLAFYIEMGNRPPDMSLDLIDHDGTYEPGNCRWVPKSEKTRTQVHRKLQKVVGYAAAHQRVLRKYGKASEYDCEHCPRPAAVWTLMRQAKDVWQDHHGRYSHNVCEYIPLCRSCHKLYANGSHSGHQTHSKK